MIILKVEENPFRKYAVKNLPQDAEYRQQSIHGNKVYYSKSKQCYYEVIDK